MALDELKNSLSAIPVAGEILAGVLDTLTGNLPAAPSLPGGLPSGLPDGLPEGLPGLESLPLPTGAAPSLPGLDALGGLAEGGLPTPPAALPGLDSLPGADALPLTPDAVAEALTGNLPEAPGLELPGAPELPGLDALPLPTDGAPNLDMLTSLLDGGLPEAPALPGLDALTGLLDGGLPEAPALPGLDAIPGLDALPGLESLTGLLGGELPGLPGAGSGELPSSPISFEDGTLTLALPDSLPISASISISGLELPQAALPIPA